MMVAGHQIETTTHGLGETGAGLPREAMAGPMKEIVAGPLKEIVAGLLTDGLLTGTAPAQSGQEMGENSHQVAPRHETRVSSGWESTQGNGRGGRAAPA